MTNVKFDRREIARLLGQHFPSMPATATSDDWQGFLDEITGIQTSREEPNATAFDRWRQTLAAQGYPVWGVSQERAAAIKARGVEMRAAEDKRIAELPAKLAELKKEAPQVSAADLLKQK